MSWEYKFRSKGHVPGENDNQVDDENHLSENYNVDYNNDDDNHNDHSYYQNDNDCRSSSVHYDHPNPIFGKECSVERTEQWQSTHFYIPANEARDEHELFTMFKTPNFLAEIIAENEGALKAILVTASSSIHVLFVFFLVYFFLFFVLGVLTLFVTS